MPSRCRRITLLKAVEYERQEVGGDPNAVVLDDDASVSPMSVERERDAPAFGREFQGIRQEIRYGLLEARRIRLNEQ